MLASLNKYQRFVLLIAWLGWVFDVMEASLFGLTKTTMLTEMLGEAQYKLVGTEIGGKIHTGMLLGWSLGGLIFGVVADRWGRSKTLILTVGIYCIFTGFTALCRTPDQVYYARLLTGLGIGGEWAAGAALIAETMPNDFRARAAALLQTAAAIGSITGVFVSIGVGELNWRLVYLAGIIPAIICLLARFKLEPDKPRERKANSLALLEVIRSKPFQPNQVWKSFRQLHLMALVATKPYNKNLLLAILIGVIGITGGGILPFWLPDFIKAIVPKQDFAFWKNLAMIILHLGTLAGVLVFPPLTDKFGRRPMFAVFGILAGVALFLTSLFSKNLAAMLILPPITSFFALGLTAGFGLYFTELFSHRFRATGSGMAYNTGRILSAPVPKWIGSTMASKGIPAAIGPVACIYFLMLGALIFAPETKGKPLED